MEAIFRIVVLPLAGQYRRISSGWVFRRNGRPPVDRSIFRGPSTWKLGRNIGSDGAAVFLVYRCWGYYGRGGEWL